MKWRKIMDGVYEGESFEPEPLGEVRQHREFSPDDGARKIWQRAGDRMKEKATDGHYHYNFPSGDYYYGDGPNWHIDGGEHSAGYGYTHMLVMIATDDPTLGTEVGNLSDGSVMRCKTWTPYLLHYRVLHRSPPDGGKADRKLYRWYVNLECDESQLTA